MLKTMQSKLKSKKGFTLIEIIVVLVIIAILVAIALPSMFGYVEEARAKSRVQEARVGFIAAQWVVSEAALVVDGDTTARDAAADAAVLAINAAAVSDIKSSFESKLTGVAEDQVAAAVGDPGFSNVVATGSKVTGITYNDGTYTIKIADGVTTVVKNTP